jgi:hypothetical protein
LMPAAAMSAAEKGEAAIAVIKSCTDATGSYSIDIPTQICAFWENSQIERKR